MSTQLLRSLRNYLLTGVGVLSIGFGPGASALAQQWKITLKPLPESGRVLVEGSSEASNSWSFRDEYAGVLGLAGRIEKFTLIDEKGAAIPARKLAPGQFQTTQPATRFQYEVNLSPPPRFLDAAKVSWLSKERGLLMLADLLPIPSFSKSKSQGAVVRFDLPPSWKLFINGTQASPAEQVSDIDQAVFALGSHLRSSQANESGMAFGYVTDSEWAFTDADALEMIGKILKTHRDVFGAMPARQAEIVLFPFPQTTGPREWSAETRGSTVTLLMGKLPSKVGALIQLSTPLTHEFFHLWVPNGLALEGDYDWFYEGFTTYEAARAAVRLDQLTFPEFLNAIGRAYDGYLGDKDRDRFSLIEASKMRWTGGAVSVYSKSMVVAFLIDLKIRSDSGGKRSLDNIYRKLFAGSRLSAAETPQANMLRDGNAAVMDALTSNDLPANVVSGLIRSPLTIDLQRELEPYGLTVETFGLRTRVAVSDKLTKHQRDLLRELGYNDAVRSPRR